MDGSFICSSRQIVKYDVWHTTIPVPQPKSYYYQTSFGVITVVRKRRTFVPLALETW